MSQFADLLTFVIPVAIGSAISPTLLITTTGLLSQQNRPRAKAMSFFVGAVVSLVVWILIVYSFVWAIVKAAVLDAESHISIIDAAGGVLLLAAAAYLFVNRSKPALLAKQSKGDEEQHLWHIAALGAVMQGRDFTSIVLFISALQHIATSSVYWLIKLAVLAGLVAITTVFMWLPLVAHVTIPHSFMRKAKPLTNWLRKNARMISMYVCLVFGIYLLVRGVVFE